MLINTMARLQIGQPLISVNQSSFDVKGFAFCETVTMDDIINTLPIRFDGTNAVQLLAQIRLIRIRHHAMGMLEYTIPIALSYIEGLLISGINQSVNIEANLVPHMGRKTAHSIIAFRCSQGILHWHANDDSVV